MTIGQATYEPGWKWSTHVGPVAGTATCQVAHVGMVVSGRAAVAMEDGTIYELAPGVSLLLRLGMIAGSSGRNPMCPSISLEQKTMPAKRAVIDKYALAMAYLARPRNLGLRGCLCHQGDRNGRT